MKQLVTALLVLVLGLFVAEREARAQSCCAGSGALTPGRLALHEKALIGAQLRADHAFGSFDGRGHYATNPTGANEQDFEEDVFGAIRFLEDGQAALLVPLVETRRQARGAGSEFGGGIGDVNASARWDFVAAGEHKILPGIGVLAGVTFPTGRPPESAGTPLATGATGIGAWQANVGLAVEQLFGNWLVNVSGIVAKRTPREVQGVRSTLGTQVTALAALAYAFDGDAALAGVVSYTFEGDATVSGTSVPDSGRRQLRVSGAGSYPLSDRLRLQGSLFFDPPIVHVDQNQITTFGLTFAALFSWS